MFGRRKRPAAARPTFGLADLAGPDGTVQVPDDGVPAPPVSVAAPADVPGFYRDNGIELPDLEPRRAVTSGVTVWRTATWSAPDAESAWTRARDLHPRTGLWPVLVGADFWERFDDCALEPEIDRGDGRTWLHQRLTAVDQDVEALSDQIPRRADRPWQPVEDVSWSELVAAEGTAAELVLVPAAAPWLVPAALAWDGAVNHEILGPEHTTVLRRWSAAYGAEVVLLGSDTLTLRVARPPAGRDAALRTAVEAVAYCSDSVFQGVETLEALAELMTGPVWSFWWD